MRAFPDRRYRSDPLRPFAAAWSGLWAAGTTPVSAESPADAEAAREREAFVADNVVFTFYHELGHALIDLARRAGTGQGRGRGRRARGVVEQPGPAA